MKKSFTADEAQEQASRVLIATLSIPDGADAPSDLTRHLDIEDQHVSNIRCVSAIIAQWLSGPLWLKRPKFESALIVYVVGNTNCFLLTIRHKLNARWNISYVL